jgi:hypothetical protein
MRYEWPKKTQNLQVLVDSIADFFRTKCFTVRTAADPDKTETVKILAIPTIKTEIRETVGVEVSRTHEGIVIGFLAADKAEETIKLGVISQILIGGILLMKGASKKEKIDTLETEFWTHVQELIAGLTD